MFHICFSSLEKSKYMFFFSFSFILALWCPGTAESSTKQFFILFIYFLLVISSYGFLAEIWWSAHILWNTFWFVQVPFGHMVVWSNFNFLHVLCFDLLTRPKMPFKVMHRKEVTHSSGSCERNSRRRKFADEMGRGKKKKVLLYSHGLTHRKRVTSELHDSYFRSMTITQGIPKLAEVKHPGR